jgi:HlyD family secretion protein
MTRIITLLLPLVWLASPCDPCFADASTNVLTIGTVEPTNLAEVTSTAGGQIEKFGIDPKDASKTIDYGTQVIQGQMLLQIDRTTYQVAVDKAKAELDQARAHLVLAKAYVAKAQMTLERQTTLRESRTIPAADLETAKLDLDAAKAGADADAAVIAQRQADVKLAELNLGHCIITSPVDGFILDRRINPRGSVTPNQTLFLICGNSKKFQVWASVNEADIARVAKGQQAHFSVGAFPNKKFTGRVSQVRLNAAMSNNTVTYTVVIDIDDAGSLLPYMTANVEIETGAAK